MVTLEVDYEQSYLTPSYGHFLNQGEILQSKRNIANVIRVCQWREGIFLTEARGAVKALGDNTAEIQGTSGWAYRTNL
jgi:hypothetical protein